MTNSAEIEADPYAPALLWIRKDPGTGSAVRLAKLILSLWNDEAAYSFRECASWFDDIRSAWALKMISHFLHHGEDRLLFDAGKEVYELCPHLWQVGYARTEAKRAALKEMERQRQEGLGKEHPEWFDG